MVLEKGKVNLAGYEEEEILALVAKAGQDTGKEKEGGEEKEGISRTS